MAADLADLQRTSRGSTVPHRSIAGKPVTPVQSGVPLRTSRRAMSGTQSALRPVRQYTTEDDQLQPNTQPPIPINAKVQPSTKRDWLKHPATVAIGTLVGVLLFLWCTTAGLALVVAHAYDPYVFGPQHGNSIDVVLGGGDSAQQKSKLIAMNNEGRVQIIKIIANDATKAQLLGGPNLIASGFPDPKNANIMLTEEKDSVRVTLYGSMYDYPLYRHQITFTLVKDGNGGLTEQK